ncbi:MAG TPA: 23S rRNA (guanosine(2251)-2'-O)-methyltransferase RlmB [Thermoanaerobaculia bacterium]|nr:23S rRNA (guanosine(2251)-2'-O)-methyltransferase RlmB [Thermoanaerobaculia bacterium]
MIIYGLNPVTEALRADPARIHFIGVSRAGTSRPAGGSTAAASEGKLQKLLSEARRLDVPVRQMPPEQLDRMAEGGVHNGVVADVSHVAYADFDGILARASTSFVLILDSIQDPQNFGAILRVADGFGVHLVVIPEHESVGLTAVAVKASAGASEWVPVAQVTNLARAIERLQKEGFWVYGSAGGGEPIDKTDFSGKVAIVLGNEGKGIRRNVLDHCDAKVSIPMLGHIESFNVATAAAVVCYEVQRQQRKKAREQ